MDKRKVGIMGGTFNPIHNGHLLLAEIAQKQFDLEKVLFMPTKNPPHKSKKNIVDDIHRVNMVKAAIADNSNFSLSLIEFQRPGITYTADTLMELNRDNKEIHYYFIIGADSLFYIDKWMRPADIFSNCTVIAAVRDHCSIDIMKERIQLLKQRYQADILILKSPNIDISSEEIRKKRSCGLSLTGLVPDVVLQYIEKHNLYTHR